MTYPTMPNPALQPNDDKKRSKKPRITIPSGHRNAPHSIPQAQPQRQSQPLRRPSKPLRRKFPRWLLILPFVFGGLVVMVLLMSVLGLRLAFANTILPQVTVAGIEVGGMTVEEAETVISRNQSIILSDENRTAEANLPALGIALDARQTAEAAFAQGHGEGGLAGLLSPVEVAPVVAIDANMLRAELERIAANFNIAPVNAGVQLVNGQVQPTQPQLGRAVNLDATVSELASNAGEILADGNLELVMQQVQPAVMDATPIVQQAEMLLSNPLEIRVFDPVTGDSVFWSVNPSQWGNWLTATSNPDSPIGLSLDVDSAQLESYLTQQAEQALDDSRTVDVNEGVESVRAALQAGRPQDGFVQVQHRERAHVVQSGETITSIAWDYGIPYLYIMEANGGIQDVSIGQTITIPPADMFLDLPVNPNKRIVVSIGEQRTRVYENGQLLYDWVTSTGIQSSPTWTGVYQVISHEPQAYAANWNLYMPNFIGIYQPVPNSEFTNGFHGFPTRGGGQLLWENSLGTRVTYGCVLLSDQNVQTLYDWAEEGVVVEIRA
jgi:lipoprotein-anchoring transpeptidase ErfK/SrfK